MIGPHDCVAFSVAAGRLDLGRTERHLRVEMAQLLHRRDGDGSAAAGSLLRAMHLTARRATLAAHPHHAPRPPPRRPLSHPASAVARTHPARARAHLAAAQAEWTMTFTALSYSSNMEYLRFGSWDEAANNMTWRELTASELDFTTGGVRVTAYTCDAYCATFSSCGDCTASPYCGWCGATSTCVDAIVQSTCASGFEAPGSCCAGCSGLSRSPCQAEDGCCWCAVSSTCISGTVRAPCIDCNPAAMTCVTPPPPSPPTSPDAASPQPPGNSPQPPATPQPLSSSPEEAASGRYRSATYVAGHSAHFDETRRQELHASMVAAATGRVQPADVTLSSEPASAQWSSNRRMFCCRGALSTHRLPADCTPLIACYLHALASFRHPQALPA